MEGEIMDGNLSENKISRRFFLKGAALTGVATVGITALGGCANEAEKKDDSSAHAETTPATSAERWPDGWVDTENTSPIPPVEPPASWDKEADVVIVGGGGGGVMAAYTLAREGLSVILLEKAERIGGSTAEAMVWCSDGGSTRLWKDGWSRDATPFSVEATTEFYMQLFENSADRELIRTMVAAGPKSIDACLDAGIELVDYFWQFSPDINSGLLIPKNAEGTLGTAQLPICEGLESGAISHGAEIVTLTPAKTLVADEGRVVGVIGTSNETGEDISFHAKKAVLLTAGGIGCNRDMLLRYIPVCGVGAATATVMPMTTGECIRMGLGLDAAISGLDTFSVRDGGIELPKNAATMFRSMYDGGEALFRQPWLGFNALGERLHYWTTNTTDLHAMGKAEEYTSLGDMCTFGHRRIVVFDSGYEEHVKNFKESSARTLFDPETNPIKELQLRSAAINDTDWRDGLQRGIDGGYIFKADTLEELAELLEVNPEVVKGTVEEWNTACENGEDESYLGYKPEWLIPVKNPPFYAAKTSGAIQGTGAGLRVNADMQVITTKGDVIPGLYAGFQTAGDFGGSLFGGTGCQGGAGGSYVGGYMAYEGIMKNE